MNKNTTVNNLILIFAILIVSCLNAKEVTDQYGKTCHTVKINQDMVEFVRIKTDKIFLYKEENMEEPLTSLEAKVFVQLIDRDGKLLKVRAFVGENSSVEGWINKAQVFTTKDMVDIYYGEDYDAKNKEKEVKDVDLNITSWIIKDIAKLYFDPLPESDYKYEIYLGLKLEVKRQHGNFYFVQIYNSILEEYRTGWVRIEDTGSMEFFVQEFEKRKAEYINAISETDTQISLMHNLIVSTNKEIAELEHKKSLLELSRYESGRTIEDLKIKKRSGEDEETRRFSDYIATIEEKIKEYRFESKEYQAKITSLEKDVFKSNMDIDKFTARIEKLKNSVENLKAGVIETEPVQVVYTYDEYEDEEEKKTIQLPPKEEQAAEEDKCSAIKDELNGKSERFEKVRAEMSGQITKAQYNKLYEEYMATWSDIGRLKKELSSCEVMSKSQHIALYNEALSLKKDEEYDDALELLYEAVELKSDFDEAYFQIVSILITQEDDKSVSQYIDKIADKEKRGKMYYKRALTIRDKYPKNALSYLQTMARFYKPELAYYHIGLLYSEKYSDYENSIKFLKKAVEIENNDPKTLEALGANFLELKPPKGEDKKTYVNNALKYLERAYKNSSEYKNKDVLCARLSQAYNLAENFTEALKYADIAIAVTKVKPFGFGNLEKGKALINLGKKSEAKKYLLEAQKDMTTKTEAEFWLNELGK